MATVYAIFPSGSALDEAMSRLSLGHRAEVIPPTDLESDATGNYDGEGVAVGGDEGMGAALPPLGAGGGVTIGGSGLAMVPATAALAGALRGPGSRLDNLPDAERRIFENALQNGSHVLVVRHAEAGLEAQLRQAGAEQVMRR
ncbi:MAG: hypothetical protein SFU83_10800 [Meiothermus sp.]|nr:hypothetical protein [Meiothermus sp.]